MTAAEQATLAHEIRAAAEARPDRGMTLFDGRGRRPERRSYRELVRSAAGAAGRIAGLGVKPGDVVVVALPTSWAWCESWLGALFAGALPVATAPPPVLGSGELFVRRVRDVAERLDARLALVTPTLKASLAELAKAGGPQLLEPEELAARAGGELPTPEVDPRGAAFLQLTSGSTGRQRAAAISHRNALHQLGALDVVTTAPLGGPASSVLDATVSWLPLYHDMGLNGGFLYALVNRLELFLYPPHAFAGRPELWLECLGSHGVSLATGPNFGYQLCVERVSDEKAARLDLRTWRAALTGAEMIRTDTLDAFVERFAPSGFDRRAIRPCYGMAEATLAVTLDRAGEGPRTRPLPKGADAGLGLSELVSTGPPLPDTELRIAAPDGSALPDGEVGEVQVRGGGVFLGYHGDAEATAETLRDGWLRTGDLGFLADGELYVAGRKKDLLIVRGQNLMPHEIEWLAESATGGGGSQRSAAFSIARDGAGEEVVLVLEIDPREGAALAKLADEVRSRIGRALALPVADVAFVRRGRIPKTTSGKVQRAELRRRYLEGEIERLPAGE
ncbi:MAG: AMP-binding protein [Myxococcota bacterium]|nr:AMP-binding protein [Myxococcota bacterium]